MGWGPIDLPEIELQTTAYWVAADALPRRLAARRARRRPARRWTGDADRRERAADGRSRATSASSRRSAHRTTEAPTIYLYEAVPGGVGLSERLWDRHDELVAGAAELIVACGCESGCPSCTGPRASGGEAHLDARRLALRLLGELGAPVAERAASAGAA